MVLSRRLRFEILRRDGHACRYCGRQAPDVKLTVDHVIPVTLGGGDDPRNLVTACTECNAGKSSIAPDQPIVEDVDATALLFARAIEAATARRVAELEADDKVVRDFYRLWCDTFGSDTGLFEADNWEHTVLTFLARGLTMDDLERFMDVTLGGPASYRQVFRYFCGCCWRELTTREELARRLIEDGDV
jgi:HNH endonuclease